MSVDLNIIKGKSVKTKDGSVRIQYGVTARNLTVEEVDAARSALEAKIDTWLSDLKPAPTPIPSQPIAPTPSAPTPAPPFDPKTIFPQELRELLSFEQTDKGWKITPRQYLGSENFGKIAQIVRDAGGEYISAGKSSHFIIPRR